MAMKSPTHEPVLNLEWRVRKTYSIFFTLKRYGRTFATELEGGSSPHDPDDTTVHISHAMFIEYFRRANQTTAVAVDVVQGNCLFLRHCLSFLSGPHFISGQADKISGEVYYMLDHWIDHFLAMDLTRATAADKQAIPGYLYQVFTDKDVIRRWTTYELNCFNRSLNVLLNDFRAVARQHVHTPGLQTLIVAPQIAISVQSLMDVAIFSSNFQRS